VDVLFLDQFSELGGAQKCLLDLLPAIEARGWRAAAALPGAGPLVGLLRARGVPVHPIPCGPYRSGSKSISDVARFTRDLRQQVKILRPLEFDLLYVNGPRMLAAAAMAFGDRAPVLFHAHSRIPAGPQSWLADWSLRRLNATVAACARAVAPGVPSNKLKLIPNGTPDLSGADPLVRSRRPRRLADEIYGVPKSGSRGTRADQGVRPTENWRIGMIGAIRPEKGQLEFLRAAATLAPEFKDVRFVLCAAPADPQGSYFRSIGCSGWAGFAGDRF
jgi:glycosyltransferase involved in cell wall biosynthesis